MAAEHPINRRLRRRQYLNLGLGELFAAAVFAGIAASGLVPGTDTPALWWALTPLLAILVQAGIHWLSARRWVGRATMPGAMASAYLALRLINPLLLTAGLVGMIAQFPDGGAAALTIAVWLFGVLEYLNYFVVRLSYPIHRWASTVTQWRTPQLVKDIRAAGGSHRDT